MKAFLEKITKNYLNELIENGAGFCINQSVANIQWVVFNFCIQTNKSQNLCLELAKVREKSSRMV